MGSLQLLWTLLLGTTAVIQASAAPSINVGMKAAFSAGPYMLELLETAAGENATSYFPLLDRIADGRFSQTSSEAELYAEFLDIVQVDGHITSPEALSTFKLALSLRSAAPRVEAHYQYYATAVEPTVGEASASECLDWVHIDGKRYCDASLTSSGTAGALSGPIKQLPFDRSIGTGRLAILYADPTSSGFRPLHKALREASERGEVTYTLRYRPIEEDRWSSLPVSGFGVELALKRTDYIVIDDREAAEDTDQKPVGSKVSLDGEEEVTDLRPLSTSELAPLGLKAASFILQNSNPLENLVKLTQDFPKYSASIASQEVSEEVAAALAKNKDFGVPPGINFLWMNGMQLIERQIEPFSLVDMIRRERKIIDGVRELGFNGQEAVSLLGHGVLANSKRDELGTRYDWTDRQEDGQAIMWLNDLENDALYEDFPKTLNAFMQRVYPGQLPPIAKNAFHAVFPVDLTDKTDIALVAQLTNIMSRGIPIRFGLIPATDSVEAIAQAKVAHHLLDAYGSEGFIKYLQAFSQLGINTADEGAFAGATTDAEVSAEASKLTFVEVLESEALEKRIEAAKKYQARLQVGASTPSVFVNGLLVPREGNWMQSMASEFGKDLQIIQMGVFHGSATEDTWLPGIFLQDAFPGRNSYIMPKDEKDIIMLDVSKLDREHADFLDSVPVLEAYADSSMENWAALTVVTDLSKDDGLQLLLSALAFKRDNPGVRLDVIHSSESLVDAGDINRLFKRQAAKLADVETLEELQGLLVQTGPHEENGYEKAARSFLADINIKPGSSVLILNGRMIGPITPEVPFTTAGFQQFLELEQRARILPVYGALDSLGLNGKISGPLAAAKLTSMTALSTISDLPEGIFESAPTSRNTQYATWSDKHAAIEVGDPEKCSIHIAGILNPVSEQGQRWAPILKVLSELDGVYLKIFMNPKHRIEELPVKRFFRYVLNYQPSFDEEGRVVGPNATFSGLPSEALLTAGMDVPPAWLVASKESVHDLDNIKLSSVSSDIHATYELEHILIEGHSREIPRGQPPRGAQLVLGTEANPHLIDTIIMSNLGYFQFKSNPGFYNIELKQGRSAEIYDMVSIGAKGWAAVEGDEGTDVALLGFQGATLYPRLKRKPGMAEEDVLEAPDVEGTGIMAKGMKLAGSLFGAKTARQISAEEHAEINIFSVASGHLYERMLNIMMVSVMKHTQHTVKFWFIEQFLSPSFKQFIPHLAAAYGFKYEMVTYKWPHWLRRQKEKQREIWGYKILFLDVLFPLNLDKVIFVDADQIVRTDMMTLVDHDLEGAPYGFTPMCDSRTEMEGFRFWKQGYWKNYLRGKPYHISALYVVDLHRFRALAAGDRLRQTYHTLSADPNSLSNLDQDLPNHMQFQIPIHSLPQEWLWCETWCSDESLGEARTIDLCNNPETKEPKLDRARRQVPEWTVYDEEIANVGRSIREERGEKETGGKKTEKVHTKSRRFEEPIHTKDEL